MFFVSFLICTILALQDYRNSKRVYNPVFLFCLFWAIISLMAGLRFYGLYEASAKAYMCIILGTCSYYVGAKFASANYKSEKFSYILSQKRFNIALLLCLISLTLNIQFLVQFVSSGFSISYIYHIMASTVTGEDTELSSLYSTNLVRLQQFVGYPLLLTLVPISFLEFITTKKKKFLFVFVFFSIIRFCYDFRRTYIVIIVVFVVFVFLQKKHYNIHKSRMTKRQKIKIYLFFIIFVFLYSSLSAERGGNDNGSFSFLNNLYGYYAGALPYFSQRLELYSNTIYTFGFSSLRGLAAPFCAIGGLLGFPEPLYMTIANENVNSLHNVVLTIKNDGSGFNSYATCFFQFYQDGGYLGIIGLSMLFGFYSYKLYLKAINNCDNRSIMIYSLFLSIFVFLSVLHFNGVVVCYIWPFILERFLYKKQNI